MYNDNPTLEELQKVIKRQGRDLTELERKLDYYLKFNPYNGSPGGGAELPSINNLLNDPSFEGLRVTGAVDSNYTFLLDTGAINYGNGFWWVATNPANARVLSTYATDDFQRARFDYQAIQLTEKSVNEWVQAVQLAYEATHYTLSIFASSWEGTSADNTARAELHAIDALGADLGLLATAEVNVISGIAYHYKWNRGRVTVPVESFPAGTTYLEVRLSSSTDKCLCDAVQLIPSKNIAPFDADNGLWRHINGLAGYDHKAKKAMCKAYYNAAQSIQDNTMSYPSMNSEYFDNDNMHDNVTNNGRITINTAGKYMIIALIAWASNAAGYRWHVIRKNTEVSGERAYIVNPTNGDSTILGWPIVEDCIAGDYFDLVIWQNSGGALNLNNVNLTAVRMDA